MALKKKIVVIVGLCQAEVQDPGVAWAVSFGGSEGEMPHILSQHPLNCWV